MALKPIETINKGFKANSKSLEASSINSELISTWLKQGFNLDKVSLGKQVQSLWSGYGDIVQFNLSQSSREQDSPLSVVVKWVNPPTHVTHPRGWQSDLAHQRKLLSYQVEMNAYTLFNQVKELDSWPDNIHIPHCYHGYIDNKTQQQILILEDLDISGFPLRYSHLSPDQTLPCIHWLASFHAYFLQDSLLQSRDKQANVIPGHLTGQLKEQVDNLVTCAQGLSEPWGLWPVGSYWHLATRPNEWEEMPSSKLKSKAALLDKTLNDLRFNTLIHGDAKVANFCFSNANSNNKVQVAALDFQYMGTGCGMKDFIYFLGSCLSERECEQHWQALLKVYFAHLKQTLIEMNSSIPFDELESEWRFAFDLAWADFQRFLEGWSPDHKKNTAFSRALTQSALDKLDNLTSV